MQGPMVISALRAREILDSRGRPTVEIDVLLQGGAMGRASVPSGASTGSHEAHELRDGDPDWYGGGGVGRAVAHADGEIRAAMIGSDAADQAGIDRQLRQLDGTPNLSRLGANAVLGVSLAVCRAAAAAGNLPLHAYIAGLAGTVPSLPVPMVNILSGGLHARHGMDIQDFLAIPIGTSHYRAALHRIARVRQAAAELLETAGRSTLLADEGGLSPDYAEGWQALELMVRAIEHAGYRPGEDIAIALDIAATSLWDGEAAYAFRRGGKSLGATEMVALVEDWARAFPIRSIEDPLHEEDWAGWRLATRRLGHLQLVGDDLFATNAERLRHGIGDGAANAILIKVNQVGTLTGALEAMAVARAAGYATIVSARSGETEDSFIADLATGTGSGQIKIGSLRSSERLSKYNQLLRLEQLHELPYAGAAGRP